MTNVFVFNWRPPSLPLQLSVSPYLSGLSVYLLLSLPLSLPFPLPLSLLLHLRQIVNLFEHLFQVRSAPIEVEAAVAYQIAGTVD